MTEPKFIIDFPKSKVRVNAPATVLKNAISKYCSLQKNEEKSIKFRKLNYRKLKTEFQSLGIKASQTSTEQHKNIACEG